MMGETIQSGALKVAPVTDKAGLNNFLAAARRAQATNPQWVEQLHDEVAMMLDPKKSPLARANVVQPFVALRDGEPVGRIVAIIDAAHIAKYGDSCGFFGFIDAIDDAQVFAALFAEAEQFLRAKGMRRVRGPFNLNINGESGLLVSGFEHPHIVQTNHAPPHYRRHIEALGYGKTVDLLAYVCRIADSALPEKVARNMASVKEAPRIDIHSMSYFSYRRDLPRILSFFNEAWSENLYATPIGVEEGRFIGDMMLPIAKPKWFNIAMHQGEDIAVVAQIPDVNEALRGLNGKLLPFGAAKLLWRVHVRGTRRARVMLAGVAKKWRDTTVGMAAIGMLMARSVADARAAGVEEVEYSWLLEHNSAAIRPVARMLPARHTRTFRLYEKAL
ncbi:hypothetical protein K9U39_18565 [Rhodoblastus acidophilus]|uniref:N-acetyltransferase domain-containing protein n=1 Tax=Candidatus Rhodoblastus alkanivorans TaxID=2954117 RepID=A0ABS9Z5E6_9HYPH|nr:hypothetical protein [Candidatus Rhodoblastus alkanivorans]MCI4677503.1 hypothetical protein [Candidatus Rhodoblastus alkanivorans]MCI4681862.1 hypothetical protein [Candidatus Rhodoblastus alkanivorans]MDI4642912.1 hypothetical protein [Rhodoblastus acidophilus]